MNKLEEKSQNTNRTLLRLEEKLIELGYKFVNKYEIWREYTKKIENSYLYLTVNNNDLSVRGLISQTNIFSQQDIDNLQQAFNVMKQDLEELKQCQD